LPNIPTYTSRAPAPGGDSRIISAKLAQGQAVADIFGTVAKVGANLYSQQQERRSLEESSNLAAGLATTQADLDLKWEDAKKNADPTSPDFAEFSENFITKVVDPAIDALGQGVTTNTVQRQLRETQAKLRGKYRVQTTMDQAALSGAQAEQNIITLGRVQADSVYTKPETMDISIGIVDHAIKGLIAAGLDRGAALELQRTLNAGIAESAFKGLANTNPDKAIANLDKGQYAEHVPQVTQDEMRKYAEMQKEAAEVDKRRAEAEVEKAKVEAAEAAENEYTSQLILDPTKLDPRAVARDPRLTATQKRVITNFQDEEIRKRKAGIEEGAGKGPGFWNAYSKVFANGFKNTDEIYALVGPGKPLELSDANALATLWRGRRENTRASDFQDERVKSFFDGMHTKMTRTQFGGTIPGGEEAWRKFYFDKTRAIDNRGEKSLDQLIDEDSPDYVGKDYQGYMPQRAQSTYTAPEEPAERTWMDFFGGILGTAAPDTKSLDAKFKDGEEGSQAGLTALRAAIAGGMSKDEAAAYALKRGWIRPSDPKPSIAPALK
jgi:hypothetical protein